MRKKWVGAGILSLLMFAAGGLPARAGDSLYGKVTAVKSGDVMTFDYGDGQYEIRLEGIEAVKDGPLAEQAAQKVREMVLGKNARMRFEGREKDGAMQARLYTDDEVLGIKDVAIELVRSGLARRVEGFDLKYGELSAAENEARAARRGLWAGR